MGIAGTTRVVGLGLTYAVLASTVSLAGGCGGGDAAPFVAAPAAEPSGGTVPANTLVTFTSATSGATFYFTTDGVTTPACSGTGTQGASAMVAPAIWVVACKAGMNASPVVKLSYTINNIVFVTSTADTGNLGGLAGADAICAARAAAAGLPGNYRAFLSTSSVNAIDRLTGARGWVRVDGRPFADSAADVASGRILYPPRIDELGADTGAQTTYAKTGSTGLLCVDWTSESTLDNQMMGFADGGTQIWLSYAYTSCSVPSRQYCFGVDYANAVAPPAGTGRVAFVSSSSFSSGGGLAAADALCQGDATAAGLAGTFKALLAIDGASAASRFAAGTPWVRRDGVVVAESQAALATGLLAAPVDLQADGTTYLGNYGLWLGAAGFGTAGTTTTTCGDWSLTASADTGVGGVVARSWQGSGSAVGCDAGWLRVSCLQE